jgi:magnesium chelatase accessory protein
MALYQTVFSHSGHVHSVLGMMAAWQLAPLSDALARIKNPVSIFVGLNDQTIPPALAEQACKVMPQAVLHQQPQLGHLAHEERPEASANAVLSACGVI